ncbi:MAG TPA: Asp-tRNA(Asn)/Glu-tRNA(Gln) amidotransferase subunit GatA [Clostridia bacterium]|nr:Asp-tRNA(Asn)/Glu-tRNA(Gln) amidotransferase subunit GatA [Clostridia bacterium]
MKLYELTAHEIRDMLRRKEVSAKEVLDNTYSRIDGVEAKVSSYITLTREKAYKDAEIIDKVISGGETLPDLAGIPMALKDNICTEGVETTCASKILKGFEPPYNAEVYSRLLKVGSIMVGKANMDEFAMGSSTENSSVKVTKNPWDIERVPGGSSGGSAAAVAAGEAYFSLGSDTGGSIRQPAALCGVVGMKPTYGLVSRYGLVAFASSFDQIGPITRDVEDCALVMNCIAGYDPKDSTSLDVPKYDYKSALVNDVKGFKIGIPKEYFGDGIDIGIKKIVLDQVKVLEGLGANVEEMSLPYSRYALPVYYIAASAEASSNLGRYDGVRYGSRAEEFDALADLYVKTRSKGFGAEVKRRIMLGTFALSSGYYDEYYMKALQVRTLIKQDFDKAFERYDVIISPTAPNTAFKLGEKTSDPLSMYMSDICTVPVNIAGNTAISISCGRLDGLPVGMQIIGKPLDEKSILQVAYTYEKNTRFNENKPAILNEVRR